MLVIEETGLAIRTIGLLALWAPGNQREHMSAVPRAKVWPYSVYILMYILAHVCVRTDKAFYVIILCRKVAALLLLAVPLYYASLCAPIEAIGTATHRAEYVQGVDNQLHIRRGRHRGCCPWIPRFRFRFYSARRNALNSWRDA